MVRDFLNCTRIFIDNINFINKRMRGQCVARDAKTELISRHWDGLINKWLHAAILFKDDGMTRILFEVRKVNSKVKHYLLENYINECKVMHALAFLQWRLYFSKGRVTSDSSCQMEESEIQEIIDDRLTWM